MKSEKLSEDVLCFQRGNVIINGDFNTKTSNEDDFITPDKHDDNTETETEKHAKETPKTWPLMREENIDSICAKDLS